MRIIYGQGQWRACVFQTGAVLYVNEIILFFNVSPFITMGFFSGSLKKYSNSMNILTQTQVCRIN